MVGTGHLEIRVGLLPLPLEAEDHVIGVEIARWLEGAVVVPLHALAQMEGIDLAVRRNLPLLGQARHDLGATALEFDDAVVDRFIAVEGSPRRIDTGIEIFGAALRAEHQGLGTCTRRGGQGQRGDREVLVEACQVHGGTLLVGCC